MNRAQRKTLEGIYRLPTSKTLEWKRIESLFHAIGAKIIEGDGSRVRFELNEAVIIFHRPHPQKEAKLYQVRDARLFLNKAGVLP